MAKTPERRSDCPIAGTLDLVGDRWTLIVIRDLMFGNKRKYSEFLESAESITTNVLADRLKRLEEAGIIERVPYQERPTRYEYFLTEAGRDLYDTIVALVRWGKKHVPDTAKVSVGRLEKMRRAVDGAK